MGRTRIRRHPRRGQALKNGNEQQNIGNGRSRRFAALAVVAALVLVAGVSLAAGCARGEQPGDGTTNGLTGTLVVRGSDTMVNLSAAWAEGFMAANQAAEVSVQGGGSATGFTALIDGSAELANASRAIKAEEAQALTDKGKPAAVEHIVAYDAVTMIVNPQNSVVSLTMTQLSDIFTGKVTNWKDVGGPDLAITVYSRESSSGTYAFVQEHVMGKADYSTSARLMPSTESIVQAVAQDKTAIGYVGLGYVTETVKGLAVAKDSTLAPVTASVASVLDKTYPVARPLYVYSVGQAGELAQAFIDFCTSEAGSAITTELGFVPVE